MIGMSPWFAERWDRERDRREIADLEELARVLLAVRGHS